VRLVDQAGRIFRKAWSVRLSLASALLQTLFVCWQYYVDKQPHMIILITAAISISAAISRIVDQPKLRDGVRSRKTDRRK